MPGKWCDGRPSTANIWCNVGPAIPHSASTGWYADGKIKHLSIFALVELPEPIAVTQGELLRMFIASEFIDDGSGGLSVAVIFDETAGQFDPQGEQHILRFNHVDPSNKDKVTEECRDAGGIDGMFSCSFPYSVAVEFIYQDHEATMSNLDTGAEVRFYTEYAELH
jgi:hypothetical protein